MHFHLVVSFSIVAIERSCQMTFNSIISCNIFSSSPCRAPHRRQKTKSCSLREACIRRWKIYCRTKSMIGKYDFTGNRCDGKCEHNKCEQLAVQMVHHFVFSFFSFPSIELHSLPPSIHLSANENCLHDDRASTSFYVSSDSRQTRLALNSRLKEVSIRFSTRKQFNARRKTWNVNFCCFIKRFIEERGRREEKSFQFNREKFARFFSFSCRLPWNSSGLF